MRRHSAPRTKRSNRAPRSSIWGSCRFRSSASPHTNPARRSSFSQSPKTNSYESRRAASSSAPATSQNLIVSLPRPPDTQRSKRQEEKADWSPRTTRAPDETSPRFDGEDLSGPPLHMCVERGGTASAVCPPSPRGYVRVGSWRLIGVPPRRGPGIIIRLLQYQLFPLLL